MLYFVSLNAQRTKDLKRSFGFDVTNTLINVFSLSSDREQTPFSIVWKNELSKKRGNRVGLSFGVEKDEVFDNQFFITRTTNRQEVALRFGLEWYYHLANDFHFFYGFDLLGGFEREFSGVDGFSAGTSSLTTLSYTGGLGPVIGLEYEINDLVKIGTESTLYGIYTRKEEKLDDGISLTESHSDNYSLKHILPQSLYFYIMF